MMMTEQKLILRKEDIESLRSIFDDSDIIDEEQKKILNQKREKARKDNIVFGELFLYCFDNLNDYSYLFKSEDNKVLKKNVISYLSCFSEIINELRNMFENYEEEEIGSYWDGERIKEFVKLNRDKMGKLINIFFVAITGDEA